MEKRRMLVKSDIKIITHTCSISNHPVSKMPMKIRENYLQGLGSVLPMNNPYMNALFKAWEISILGKHKALAYDSNNPKERVKKAIKLNRIGWHWFRLVYPFFFDCFYLTSLCDKSELIREQYRKLGEFCNLFTNKAFERVYNFFYNGTPCEKIPIELVNHRDVNLKFESVPLKRLLVVANVSAGKSTLINALVGYKLNKTATNACTKELCYIFGKPKNDGLTIKTRKDGEYKYDSSIGNYSSEDAAQIGVCFSSGLLQGEKICFIDTPGFNDARNVDRRAITEKAIRANEYDMVMYVANAAYMGRDDEQHLLETIVRNTKKPIIFVMNGLDKFKPSEDSIEESVKRYHDDIEKLGVRNPRIIPVSARAALLMRLNVGNALDDDEKSDLQNIGSKFYKDYYDLPKYAQNSLFSQFRSSSLIDKTGIPLLEMVISII